MAKVTANSLRIGNIIEHQQKHWRVVKLAHVKPGKGGAFIQIELKETKAGIKLNERFRSEQMVERAHMEEKPYQFLYRDGEQLHLMDNQTYEQLTLENALLDEGAAPFLTDNMQLTVAFIEERPISIQLPATVVVKIESAEAVVKRQTASSSYKPALLENGIRIMVPSYITSGEKIVVNTDDASFVERFRGSSQTGQGKD